MESSFLDKSIQNILAYFTCKNPFNLLKQNQLLAAKQQLLAATPQPLQAVATNTSTGTSNNNSSTSTSTSTSTGTSTSTSSSTNNISIRNGSSSNKVYLNRIFNLGLLYGFMGLSLICLFFFLCFSGILTSFLKDETSLVRGLWLPLPTNTLSRDRTCILTLTGI